jgi:hypothetical protein
MTQERVYFFCDYHYRAFMEIYVDFFVCSFRLDYGVRSSRLGVDFGLEIARLWARPAYDKEWAIR